MLRSFYHVMFCNSVVHSKSFKNLWHYFAKGLNLNLKFELNSIALVSLFRNL
jgi:hypothetical protein